MSFADLQTKIMDAWLSAGHSLKSFDEILLNHDAIHRENGYILGYANGQAHELEMQKPPKRYVMSADLTPKVQAILQQRIDEYLDKERLIQKNEVLVALQERNISLNNPADKWEIWSLYCNKTLTPMETTKLLRNVSFVMPVDLIKEILPGMDKDETCRDFAHPIIASIRELDESRLADESFPCLNYGECFDLYGNITPLFSISV